MLKARMYNYFRYIALNWTLYNHIIILYILRPVSLSSSEEESDGARHDRPPSSVPLLPQVPEIRQPEPPQLLNIRPFVQSPPSSTSSAVTLDHRLQQGTNNATFRDGISIRILSLLEEIKETQRVHGKMIQSLLTQRDGNTVAVIPQDILFPLKTVSDVEAMELKLADPTILKEVVCRGFCVFFFKWDIRCPFSTSWFHYLEQGCQTYFKLIR